MAKGKGLQIPPEDVQALLDAKSAKAQIAAWYEIRNRVLMKWDGRSHAFFDKLSSGLRAVTYAGEMHWMVEPDNLGDAITERPDLAMRMADAFETLGADEYADLMREVEEKYPGKRFPEDAEDWMEAMEKVPQPYLKKMGKRLASGKGMKRPIVDYVVDYVRAHPEEFA